MGMNTINRISIKKYNRISLPSEFRIRKKWLKLIKFLILGTFVGFFTLVTYKLMKTYYPKEIIDRQKIMYLEAQPNNIINQMENEITEVMKLTEDFFNKDKSHKKIDWHNYEQIEQEKIRTGPGEQGEEGNFSDIPKDLLDKLYKENGYNGALSDIISLHRALPDVRPRNCSNILYKKDLPTTSVIIPFHNEHFSVILRTVWSVMNRSPEKLIKDVILVDDSSEKEFLKEELEDYLNKNIPKAKIVRLKKRSGLIVARQEGARVAEGDVFIFLDAHCEANVNWLPPLLDLIADDYRTCVCPFIDIIDYDTYKYIPDSGGRGGFNWNLHYRRLYKFKRYGTGSTEPFESPVMAGGLFAISAKFFWELGGYDEGLFIWGGEQLELSFKLWQCGGRMFDVPCSRVGHMYRKFGAFKNPDNNMDYICTNFKRVAEVWMDEYKELFYKRNPECAKMDHGDISKQLAVRKKLNCKPFKWFMEEVAYDITNRYPLVDPPDIAYGEIRNVGNPDYCIEATNKEVHLRKCDRSSWAQTVQFTWRGEIKRKESENCWDVEPESRDKVKIVTYDCHFGAGNQLWRYKQETQNIRHGNGNMCVDMDVNSDVVFIQQCNETSVSQKWKMENFNQTQSERVSEFLNNIIIDGR